MTDPATRSDIAWHRRPGYEDIIHETCAEGIARVTINRPEVRNAFRPRTVEEMIRAFDEIRDDASVGVAILTGAVVPLAELEATTLQWCREMLAMSPTALRFLKLAMNADCDGQAGMMQFAGSATLMYYTTDEGRKPDFSRFKRYP